MGNPTEFIAGSNYFLKIEGCLKYSEYTANINHIYHQTVDNFIEGRYREKK
ncbi:U32 family peptidase [Richelia intracellularis]|uniref:U32 family peptidase n=1 Tax=Richelia intracellularis TaxID=1164990 RepID=UPI0012DF8145